MICCSPTFLADLVGHAGKAELWWKARAAPRHLTCSSSGAFKSGTAEAHHAATTKRRSSRLRSEKVLRSPATWGAHGDPNLKGM